MGNPFWEYYITGIIKCKKGKDQTISEADVF